MKKLLISIALLATSVSAFAGHVVAKAVHTNDVSYLISANHKTYVQHVGGAMICPHKVHHSFWILHD